MKYIRRTCLHVYAIKVGNKRCFWSLSVVFVNEPVSPAKDGSLLKMAQKPGCTAMVANISVGRTIRPMKPGSGAAY